MWSKLKNAIRNWYVGPFVPGETIGNFIFIGHHRPTASARAVRVLVVFWQNHWKFVIGTAVAVAALFFGRGN